MLFKNKIEMTDFFGGSTTSTATDIGVRLNNIKNNALDAESLISVRPDNSTEANLISSFGKVLLNVSSLDTLITALQQGDSSVLVQDSGVGKFEIKIDNEIIAVYDVNGLSIKNNNYLKTDALYSDSGGAIHLGNSITLIADNTYDLGTVGNRFRNLYVNNNYSNITKTDEIYEKTNNYDIRLINNTRCNVLVPIAVETPSVAGTGQIGHPSHPYANLYISSIKSSDLNIYPSSTLSSSYGLNLNSVQFNSTFRTTSTDTFHNLNLRCSNSGGIILGSRNSSTLADTTFLQANSSNITINSTLLPNVTASHDLGSGSLRWNDIYSINAPTHGCDRRLKKDIMSIQFDVLNVLHKLKPVQFKWIKNESNRNHIGFIAQDIPEELKQYGFYTYQPVVSHKSQNSNGDFITTKLDDIYSLRTNELVSVLVQGIQELDNKITHLENNTTGDTFVLEKPPPAPLQQSKITTNESILEKLSIRVFNLENQIKNKNDDDVDEESEGSPNINEILQQRIHSLEIKANKQDAKLKKLTTIINKLVKQIG